MWGRHGSFDIDHFLAVALYPDKFAAYDNLLYTCSPCNAAKADRLVPDPTTALTSARVQVTADGTIHTSDPEAAHLIEMLGLDTPAATEFRQLWIGIIALAARHRPELQQRLLGYPDDLPDLARLRPPQGNTRPEGVQASCLAQRRHGMLPATY